MKKVNFDKENYSNTKIKYNCKSCGYLLFEIKKESQIKINSQKNTNYYYSIKNDIIYNKKNILIIKKEKIQLLEGDDQFCLYLNIICEKCQKVIGKIYKTGNLKIDPFLDNILLNKNDVINFLEKKKNYFNNNLNFEMIREEEKSIFSLKSVSLEENFTVKIVNDLELLKKNNEICKNTLKKNIYEFNEVLNDSEEKINIYEKELIYLNNCVSNLTRIMDKFLTKSQNN